MCNIFLKNTLYREKARRVFSWGNTYKHAISLAEAPLLLFSSHIFYISKKKLLECLIQVAFFYSAKYIKPIAPGPV